MTDKWRCRNCLSDFPSKAFALIHQNHRPSHEILHLESVADFVDPDERVTLAEVLEDPSEEPDESGGNTVKKAAVHFLRPVKSLAELRSLAQQNPAYAQHAIDAAANLGGNADTLDAAMRWLEINAMETTEEGVVEEVNFMLE